MLLQNLQMDFSQWSFAESIVLWLLKLFYSLSIHKNDTPKFEYFMVKFRKFTFVRVTLTRGYCICARVSPAMSVVHTIRQNEEPSYTRFVWLFSGSTCSHQFTWVEISFKCTGVCLNSLWTVCGILCVFVWCVCAIYSPCQSGLLHDTETSCFSICVFSNTRNRTHLSLSLYLLITLIHIVATFALLLISINAVLLICTENPNQTSNIGFINVHFTLFRLKIAILDTVYYENI